MSLIEQADKHRKAVGRTGSRASNGFTKSETQRRVESQRQFVGAKGLSGRAPADSAPVSAMHRCDIDLDLQLPGDAEQFVFDAPDRAARAPSVTLDLERLQRLGYLIPTRARSDMAEQFGQIKRPLLANARSDVPAENRHSLIMVTSALPREGKTFCAINLAISMSFEIDTSVLLVDADVMRPEVLQRLGVPAQRGLLDVLTDRRVSLSDVVLTTNVPKLSILPAGLPNNMSSELLACDAMEALLASLARTDPNRVVIFDAPPLLVTTEAKVLASRVGQVVLVVAASSTPRSAVAQAFGVVERCPIVLSVLNKSRKLAIPLGYGYYY